MRKVHYLLLSAAVIAVVALFSHTDAGANDDGPPFTIAIKFVTWSPATCTTSLATSFSCTRYDYNYTVNTGSTSNAIVDVAIPEFVMTKFASTDFAAAGCKLLKINGEGDPSTNFGKNFKSLNICRVNIPSVLKAGMKGSFSLYADPSSPDDLSWFGSPTSSAAFVLDGPYTAQAAVAQIGGTLTTGDKTVSYQLQGGTITVTGGTAIPISNTKLCVLKPGGDPTVPYTSIAFPANWTCETISFVTDQCDVKTTGGDPCRFIGGSCILY